MSGRPAETRDWKIDDSEPRLYLRQDSSHITNSDFGLLFPWLSWWIAGQQTPERALQETVRAITRLTVQRDSRAEGAVESNIDLLSWHETKCLDGRRYLYVVIE